MVCELAAAVESQLLAGCGWAVQGRPQCKPADFLAPGLRPCLKVKRQLLYPVPCYTFCSISLLRWRWTTINVEVGKNISCLLGQIASIVGGRKRKSKLCSWTEQQAAAGNEKKKKIALLPHFPLACDQLRQLLIAYIPGKKCPVV